MITKTEITKSFIESQEEFLKSLQKAVSEGIRAPLGIITDNKPEHILRTEIIIDVIKSTFPGAQPTFVIPGTIIQILFPKKELLVSIVSLINKVTSEKNIKLELCKLTSEGK